MKQFSLDRDGGKLAHQAKLDLGAVLDPAHIDETPAQRELPRAYALRMAKAKLAAVAGRHPGMVVLAADSVVVCGRRILPKAETEKEAPTSPAAEA